MSKNAAVTLPWLTEAQARARLQVSRSTFRRLRQRNVIATYRVRGTAILRFKVEDVEALCEGDAGDRRLKAV
jgi:excisionase family DNA binding protein